MEIIADPSVLLKLENAGAISGLTELFGEPHWVIAPADMRKIKRGKGGRGIAKIASMLALGTKLLGKMERKLIEKIVRRKSLLSKGEIEAIAIAKSRGLLYVTNEDAAREACREMGVNYMTLPMLLKALWAKKILGKREVREIIERMENGSRIKFQKRELILGE